MFVSKSQRVAAVVVAVVLLLPGFASAAETPTTLQFGCALKSNGLLRAVASPNDCKKQETAVTILPGPTNLCIKPDGSVRLVSSPSECGTGPFVNRGTPLTLPSSSPAYFCASAGSGVLRFVTAPSLCAAGETVFVSANHNPTDIALSNATVAENQPVDTTVGTFSAVDPDPGAVFTFSLAAGAGSTDNLSFGISGNTLRTAATFNFEVKSSYSIRVRVSDGLGGTYEEVFLISVTDVVENDPPTNLSLSNATVAENLAVGSAVGTLSTNDPTPGDTHMYTLVLGTGSTDNLKFQVSGNTLQTNAILDFESANSLSVRIRTTDLAGGSFEKEFTVTVTNSNDAPTNIALTNATVSESAAIGTTIGTLLATDPDAGDSHVFTFVTGTGSADNAKFQIVGNALKTNAILDFETAPSLSVRVRATDAAGANFEKPFTITVTDAAENSPPTDITSTPASIGENQPAATNVGTLSATDVDPGQTHTFSLQPSGCGGSYPDTASFTVVGTALKTAASFNFEVKSSYAVCIRATDNGSPVASFDKVINVAVTNLNDPPVAAQDDYSGAIGNTVAVLGVAGTGPHVVLTGNVLIQNDTDEDQPAQPLAAVAATVPTTGGGSVTIAANGSFTYLPGVADKNLVNDTFTYQLTDGSATVNGTATIDVVDALVWYANAALASNGDGRSNAPFNTLASLQGADLDGAGDVIFLYQGSYTGGLVLEADQMLLGQPEGLVVNNGLGAVTLVTAGGSNPTISNAAGNGITLAQGNTVKRVNVSTTSGDGISGVGVNTASIGSNITVSGTGGDGIDLNGGSGAVDIAAAVQNTTGEQVRIAGRSGGTALFTGAIGGTGTGVTLSSNTGATINFTGGISVSAGANEAFGASGGGTFSVTGAANVLTTTTGVSLNVANTTIGAGGLAFLSISSVGAPSGIVLNNTGSSGRLIVTGGGSAGTGGTISNGATGISLTNTTNPSFSWLQLNDHSDFAIRGSSVQGFTLANSVINGINGSDSGADEGSVRFTGLTGSASITGSTISGSVENNLTVINAAGVLDRITVSGSTFGPLSAVTGDHALLIESTGTAVINSTISNNFFTAARGTHINRVLNSTTQSDTIMTGNTISNVGVTAVSGGGAAIRLFGGNNTGISPSATFNIANNVMQGSLGTALAVNKLGGSGVFNGSITGNQIGTATPNSGSAQGSGIFLLTDGGGSYTASVTNNIVRQYENYGIYLQTGGSGVVGAGDMKVTVTGNDVKTDPSTAPAPLPKHGVHLNAGVTTGDTYRVCLTLGGVGSQNDLNGSGTNGGTDIRLRQRQSTTVYLSGYGGSSGDIAAVAAFATANNITNPTASAAVSGSGGGFLGACPF